MSYTYSLSNSGKKYNVNSSGGEIKIKYIGNIDNDNNLQQYSNNITIDKGTSNIDIQSSNITPMNDNDDPSVGELTISIGENKTSNNITAKIYLKYTDSDIKSDNYIIINQKGKKISESTFKFKYKNDEQFMSSSINSYICTENAFKEFFLLYNSQEDPLLIELDYNHYEYFNQSNLLFISYSYSYGEAYTGMKINSSNGNYTDYNYIKNEFYAKQFPDEYNGEYLVFIMFKLSLGTTENGEEEKQNTFYVSDPFQILSENTDVIVPANFTSS